MFMMAGITKNTYSSRRSEKNVENKRALFCLVTRNGSSQMPCSYCQDRGFSCVASEDSDRCSECIRVGRPHCDVYGLSRAGVADIANKFHSLEDELIEAEEAEAQARKAEELAAGRVRRLRKQRRFWAEKLKRMINRGLDSIEELDRVEREEERAREEAAGPSNVSGASPSFSWLEQDPNLDPAAVLADLDFGVGQMSPLTGAFLASVGQGSGDGNRQASTSHSGGA
ncbi:hypothetical protein F5B19DRAFT_480920 [Rostrohypoxylon terebratum]|nr:hypothetical protein F5B19DRAFT_480920 [Rostrohypoxylon terebratum]